MRLLTGLVVAIMLGNALAAAAQDNGLKRPPADERSVGAFVGVLTTNQWDEILFKPGTIEPTDPGLAGLTFAWPIGRVFRFGKGTLSLAIEWEIVRQFSYQNYWETSLPGSLRYRPGSAFLGLFDGFAFAIGPSYTSRDSPHEGRFGAVQRSLIYWYVEADHLIGPDKSGSAFVRLHHRSNGFGLMGTSGSSNALVIGYRRSF
jgi:hypothetical protein